MRNLIIRAPKVRPPPQKSPSSIPALFLSDALARPVHRLHVQTGSSLPAHEECPCDASCTVCVPCPAMSALCRTLDKVSRSAEKRCEKDKFSCALRRWHLRPIVFFLFIRCASNLLVRVLTLHRSEKSSLVMSVDAGVISLVSIMMRKVRNVTHVLKRLDQSCFHGRWSI